ncbi:hypothetical protein ACS0TY_010184 [Phlomoides rotata]
MLGHHLKNGTGFKLDFSIGIQTMKLKYKKKCVVNMLLVTDAGAHILHLIYEYRTSLPSLAFEEIPRSLWGSLPSPVEFPPRV